MPKATLTITTPAITAVLFDADGVIQQPSPGWQDALEGLCDAEGRSDEFLEDVFSAERPCLTGAKDFREQLAVVLSRWRSSVPVDQALRAWAQIEAHSEIMAIAGRLRAAGVTVALATNQQPYRAAYMTHELAYGTLFDHLLYSCELGHAKPSHDYFAMALANLQVAPGQALFIDDHEPTVAAARISGLHAETFHVSEGALRLEEILNRYGLGERL